MTQVDSAGVAYSHDVKTTRVEPSQPPPRALVGHGPRDCEDVLFALLDRHGAAVEEFRPLHIVVPSTSLRSHLLEAAVRRRGRSVVGLGCSTLHALALDLVEAAGRWAQPAGGLFPVLVRRLARGEPALSEALDSFNDGYASVVGSVTDLLEAGTTQAHAEALEEVLTVEGPEFFGSGPVERACAIVRVAARARDELDRLELTGRTGLLERATDIVRSGDGLAFAPDRLVIYGFADATGTAIDLLEALLDRFASTIILDHPLDPSDPSRVDPGILFTRHFTERITGGPQSTDVAETSVSNCSPPAMFRALGVQAEVREVGARIRALLDAGTRPESIGIVARQLEPYRSALRTHLWRLGVPFSGHHSLGPLGPLGRRMRAVLDLIGRGPEASIDRWLDAREGETGTRGPDDLRLALFNLGVGRLTELAVLDPQHFVSRKELPLPVRQGFVEDEDPVNGPLPSSHPHRRTIQSEEIEQARSEAVALSVRFEQWQATNRLDGHLRHFSGLLEAGLRWNPEGDDYQRVVRSVEASTAGFPTDLAIDFDEFLLLLRGILERLGHTNLGGSGGGVQILDVIEARSRTFEHLFLIGLNRGNFPRSIREDPLLPDSLRQLLSREGHGVLPDLARKRVGYDEERFLFAQLLSASPRVTLSWLDVDDDNALRVPSPLVERIRWAPDASVDAAAQTPVARSAVLADQEIEGTLPERTLTAYEHAVRSALIAGVSRLDGPLAVAIRRAGEDSVDWTSAVTAAPVDATAERALAAARAALIAEYDRAPGELERLGPFFGFIGSAGPDDPRSQRGLYATTLEGLARCPWRTFLGQLLRIEPHPDPVDVLPAFDALVVGQLVHAVLEEVARRALPEPTAEPTAARSTHPVAAPWPSDADLDRLLEKEAVEVTQRNGIGLVGYAPILARLARPYLEVARDLMPSDVPTLIGVELEGGSDTVRFRADRVDRIDGKVVLTDFKTSAKGVSKAVTADTRRKHLLADVRSGLRLQAVAYAMAGEADSTTGRYLFLHPALEGGDEHRTVEIAGGDTEIRDAFDQALASLRGSWEQGSFFPRLVEVRKDQEPSTCGYCAVAEACLRHDSGARGRLHRWTLDRAPEAAARAQKALSPAELALLATWFLGQRA